MAAGSSIPPQSKMPHIVESCLALMQEGYTLARRGSGAWVLLGFIDFSDAIAVSLELASALTQSGHLEALEEVVDGAAEEWGLYSYDDERVAAAAAGRSG